MRHLVRIASMGLALACVVDAHAASLRLGDGSTMQVRPAQRVSNVISVGSSAPPLEYRLVEPGGRSHAGTLEGSRGVRAEDVAIGQNPGTGDVFVVFAAPAPGGARLVASQWLGQGFAEPLFLSDAASRDHRPMLAFTARGEALLAWQRGMDGRVLLRHFNLDPSGQSETYTFVDAGRPADLLTLRWGTGIGSFARVAGVLPSHDAFKAYILVSTLDGSSASVLQVTLDSVIDPGGFGAAPVPVTFTRPAANSGGSGYQSPRTAAPGIVVEPWRMTMTGGTAWYWVIDGVASLVAFQDDMAGRLITFPAPADQSLLHAEAHLLARGELGFAPRRPGLQEIRPSRRGR